MSEDEDIKTWIKFHESLSLFCYTKSRHVINTFNELIDSIVGESTENYGSICLLSKLISDFDQMDEICDLKQKIEDLNYKLRNQEQNSKMVIEQLKQVNLSSKDREWKLQESLANTEHLLQIESDRHKISLERMIYLEGKLNNRMEEDNSLNIDGKENRFVEGLPPETNL